MHNIFPLRKLRCKAAFFLLLVIIFVAQTSYRNLTKTSKLSCAEDNQVLFNEEIICEHFGHKRRYLSYQPPGGGWNNQRVALENAIVISRMLNRTLIVHPVAPHDTVLRQREQGNITSGYHIYNSLDAAQLIPLSQLLDLKRLSHFVPVKEEVDGHSKFAGRYAHLSWRNVCHNGHLVTWLDELAQTNSTVWKVLKKLTKKHHPDTLPTYRQICEQDMNRFRYDVSNSLPFWGILDELKNADEEMIYFEQGSLYVREILFTSKLRALDATKVVMWSLKPAHSIQVKVNMLIREIGHPFNAIHVRRTDHPSSINRHPDYWLRRLNTQKALGVTNKLYVATDEVNKTWFQPFTDAGYKLFFADDFEKLLDIKSVEKSKQKDIKGMHEQLVCTFANVFVGSYYSTFSLYIERMRKGISWFGIELGEHTGYKWIGPV